MKKLIALCLVLAMALTLCACGGSKVNERYLPLIECLDNHDYEGAMGHLYALREEAIENGDIVVLEPQEEDYDLVNRYRSVAYFLKDYTPTGYNSLRDPATDEYLQGNDALALAYTELQALEGVDQWLTSDYFEFEEGLPTDRAALLSRFSTVADKLIKTERTTLDNMGNESTNEGLQLFYDADGMLTCKYVGWYDAQNIWDNLYSYSGYYHYTYDANGVITQTKITDREGTDVYAVIVPAYDANGNLISETITDNNGEVVFNYTYDAAGNLIRTDFSDEWDDYGVLYTYDEAGRLIRKERHTYGEYNDEQYTTALKTTVYTYDANGNLTNATITSQGFRTTYRSGGVESEVYSEKIDNVSYTYDANGNLAQEFWQHGETVYTDGDRANDKPDYNTQTITYTYGDYYIFN